MTRHRIERRAYYLLPYAGPRRQRLVRAVRPSVAGHWEVRPAIGGSTWLVLLTVCQRVTPTEARRILGKRK